MLVLIIASSKRESSPSRQCSNWPPLSTGWANLRHASNKRESTNHPPKYPNEKQSTADLVEAEEMNGEGSIDDVLGRGTLIALL
jgi:hypothetical protein